MRSFLLFFMMTWPVLLMAQSETVPGVMTAEEAMKRNIDFVYKENIRSVKFHLSGLFLSQPIIELNSDGLLSLSFDDLDGDVKDYVYTIEHFNADWTRSDLIDMEYIDGFNEEKITEYEYSFNTITNFTHYFLALPNDNMAWTKSGNYLLKVYEDEEERELVITRRFMVVEPLFRVQADLVPAADVSKLKTHHELDFVVSHKGIKVQNARQDVKVAVLQNGRWDNAVTGLKPLFLRDEKLIYDFQDKVVFPAGKEFRFADIRSVRYRMTGVEEIQDFDDGYDVYLYRDRDRSYQAYISERDVNGGFVIENMNEEDNRLEADYANVIVSLKAHDPFEKHELYLIGALTDWQVKDAYQFKYNETDRSYDLDVKLKQGFYNYLYALVDKETGTVDTETLEGNWYETENIYTILIYFRPFGTRYDRLVAAHTIDSSLR
ncbi:MAG: DUF5103 domain-containing protein [Bacteroidota bacterium]